MRIIVVTPTRHQPEFWMRSHASVSDQDVSGVIHVVMDASPVAPAPMPSQFSGSNNGAGVQMVWLRQPDCGIYDALNQGFDYAEGELLAWLNDDEQYLPGTLEFVCHYFDEHPDVDLVFGDFLAIDRMGELLAYRKGYPPRWPYILTSHLYDFSCALFFRRRIWDAGFRFDAGLKSAGDMDFVARVLRAGYRSKHVRRYLATFTFNGENLSSTPMAQAEERKIRAAAPAWVRTLRGPLNLLRLTEKVLSGAYRQRWPLRYAIYTKDLTRRTEFTARHGSWRWPSRQFKGG